MASRRDRWGPGRIVALVSAIVVALIAIGLLAGGGGALWADLARRDASGFVTSDSHLFRSRTYAIVSQKIDLRYFPSGLLGTVRIRVTPTDPNERTFIGIGDVINVSHYLNGVRYATVTDLSSSARARYHVTPGGPPSDPPQTAGIWAASRTGSVTQSLRWKVRSGSWVVVVMNADASRGVDVRADVGARIPSLLWIAIGLLIAGVVFGGGSGLLFWVAFRTRR